MVPDSDYSQDMFISGIIKNTDNGILILDCVESEAVRYTSAGDNVVDKNFCCRIGNPFKKPC